MPSKTSSIKKQIILYDLRQVGWVSVLYFLALFVILPLQVIMKYTSDIYPDYPQPRSLFSYLPEVQGILSITVPVLFSVLLFRYLHKKGVSDFVHSFPIKRSAVLHHQMITGMFLLLIPIILNACILYALQEFTDISYLYTGMQVLKWLGILLLLNVIMFLAAMFTGMITGMFSLHVVLTYIFLILPVGFMLLLMLNTRMLVFGFPSDYYLDITLEKYSPLTYFMGIFISPEDISWFIITIYAVIGIFFYISALLLYVNRQLESTSQPIVYPFMRPVFLYGVTLCSMMLTGYYLYDNSNSVEWAVVGYIGGSLVGFVIAEAILKKTWRVYTNYKSYLLFFVFLVVVFFSAYFFKGNYENHIPEIDEVERVYFGPSYNYDQKNEYMEPGIEPLYYTEEKDIELVQNLHERLVILDKNYFEQYADYGKSATIVYELKNGNKVARSYVYPLKDPELKKLQNEIENSNNFKHANHPVFNIAPDTINQVELHADVNGARVTYTSDQKTINSIIEAIREDIESKYPQPYDESVQTYSLILNSKEGKDHLSYYETFSDSYENTIEALKEAGLYDNIQLEAAE
ncbi:DUF6449 domain-containing protein [Terribacillus sp. DMT04]|uniref:DUF6449 domain-containing protein n=1 Tax=Terribacillus sp. DMT04 TaxID=2850441 RepID=UPI001C2C79B3|nr:DUF6449 domain-containing protein [Terribacillus sp. DMT04]QXE02066.1 hypothetical protein KS242_02105 [Terribacillus sp. DMT04]